MQRVTPLLSSPSWHRITTHLSKIQTGKAERGGEGLERLQSNLQSVQLGSGICDGSIAALQEQRETFCCQRRENGGKKNKQQQKKTKTKKERESTLQEACCCYRKNRYQIKKVCLKTVHMPAPGDFKYLWFATFLIFQSCRDAACRI